MAGTRYVHTEHANLGSPRAPASSQIRPVAKTATVSATATGVVFTLARLLGSASQLALINGTSANLKLDAATGSISATAALGDGVVQKALVRESDGEVAVEYPVTLTGVASVVAPAPAPVPAPTPTPTPTVSISAAQSKNEGNSGTTFFVYTVTRSAAIGAASVPWSFNANTTSANDFVGGTYPQGGTVELADGVASGTFSVGVNGDAAVETDEAFGVSIATPAGYAAGAAMSATGTILNDDVAPVLALSSVAPSVAANAAAGTLISNIANVPAGVTPSVTPNDGRLVIAGDASGGWKVVVGLSAMSAGTIEFAVAASGATSASGKLLITAAATETITRAVLSGQRMPDTPYPAAGSAPTVDVDYIRIESRYVGSGDIATASFRLNGFYIWTDVAIKTKGAITYKELVVEVNGVTINCLPNGPMVLPQGGVDMATPDIDWSPIGGPPVQGTLVKVKCRYGLPANALGIGNSVADYEGVFSRGFDPTAATATSLMIPGEPTVTGSILSSVYTHCPIMVGTFVGGDKETIVFGGDSITVGSGDKNGQWAALPSLANGQSATVGTWEQIHTQTDSRQLGFSYAGRALAGLEPSTKVGIAGIIVARIGGIATLWTNANETDNAADGLRALVKYGSTFYEAYGTNYFDGSTNAGGAPGNALGNSRSVWNMAKANARTGSGVLPLQVGRGPIPPRRNRAADEVNAPLDQVVYGPKWDIDGNVATYLGLLDTAFANNEFDFWVSTNDLVRRGSDKSTAAFHQWLHGNSTAEDGTHPSPDVTQPWARRVRRAIHAKRNGLPVLSTITWVSAPTIPEGSPPNTVVGIINVKYETNLTMTSTAGGRFKMGRRLSGSTAEVLVAEVPTDYETTTSHQFEITESRSDLAISSRATTLTIAISDVNPEPVAEHAVVTAYKKARTVPLSAQRYSALNTFIRAIDDVGALTKLSRLYVFADPEPVTSDGGLNMVSLAMAKPIPGASPTFEPNLGYTGNGAASGALSLRTSWTDSKYSQDDAAVGVWCNGEFGGTTGDGKEHISAASGGAIWLTARSNGGTATETFRMNSTTSTTSRTGSTSRLGHRAASRTSSTDSAAYYNGQQTATSTAVSAAQTTTAQVLRAQATYSTDRIAALWSGGGLTAAQQAVMHSALYAYLNSFGAAGF